MRTTHARESRSRAGTFLVLLLLIAPLAGEAQQARNVPRIGVLWAYSPSIVSSFGEAFRQGLRGLGYVEGENVAIEERWADGKFDRLPSLAAELVQLDVDIIVTASTPAVQAAKQATRTIPIVMTLVTDPVESGVVASLARPGGNVYRFEFHEPGTQCETPGAAEGTHSEGGPGGRLLELVNSSPPTASARNRGSSPVPPGTASSR